MVPIFGYIGTKVKVISKKYCILSLKRVNISIQNDMLKFSQHLFFSFILLTFVMDQFDMKDENTFTV